MQSNNFIFFILILVMGLFLLPSCEKPVERPRQVLVFSKTEGFRHSAIEVGQEAIRKLGEENNFLVEITEDAGAFEEENLKDYAAVVFLNTTGDVLDAYQQANFERFIQAGGGFVGIHAASDTEYDWSWYGKMVGAYFMSHPAIQPARILVNDRSHLATRHLDSLWERTDEWYDFKNIQTDLNIVMYLDESSYQGGGNGKVHPIAWYKDYDGGRAFYTGLGHTEESYAEPAFLQHLAGAIEYAIGDNKLDYVQATTYPVPEENRFVQTVLARNLNEPMELDMLPDGRILFVERRGKLKLYDPLRESVELVAEIPVYTEQEDGLMGIAIDPDYENNKWIYMIYSPPGDIPKQHVSRFVYDQDSLHSTSEVVVLEIKTQRETCCHSGGSLEFDKAGNLYISVGDDTNPFASNGYSPIDERDGRAPWDAQRTSANTNDLRGKILRITPQPDGTYTIPEGNLFPPGTPNTRPEIYVMGCRNPFRISLDSKRGYLYWGDVGPDAGKDGENRGPKGIDEINVAKQAGFWGWPYSRGNNIPYYDYDFTTKESGELFNPDKPINDSPNNTGLRELPPIQKSMVWYSYDESEEFPWVKTGGKNPMAGMVFYRDDFDTEATFPPYFEGKLIAYEWMRGWMYVIKMDEEGGFIKADPFMPNSVFSRPMDMIFGKDGAMYVLEYGAVWFARNLDARLSKIAYVKGNRRPVAKIAVDKPVGGAPLTVQLSADNSIDYDNDPLEVEWKVDGEKVGEGGSTINYTFDREGIYRVTLKVTDPDGVTSTAKQEIQVGNEPPEIVWDIQANKSFFWDGQVLPYKVAVQDVEDGNSDEDSFDRDRISVTFNYLSTGVDITESAQGHAAGLKESKIARGANLIAQSDCKSCHAMNSKINGPSYQEIAKKYKGDAKAINILSYQIIHGGSGKWGESVMSAHPDITNTEAKEMALYILSLSEEKKARKGLPLEGQLAMNKHVVGEESGSYILMASYTDLGNGPVKPLVSQEQIVLRHPRIQAEDYDVAVKNVNATTRDDAMVLGGIRNGDYFGYHGIDLTNLRKVSIRMSSNEGGNIELRVGSPDGEVIGVGTIEKKRGWQEVNIGLNPTEGTKDIYVVMLNKESGGNSIGAMDWMYFHNPNNDLLSGR